MTYLTEKDQNLAGLLPEPVARAEQDRNSRTWRVPYWLALAALICLILVAQCMRFVPQQVCQLPGPPSKPVRKDFGPDSQRRLGFQEQSRESLTSAEVFRELELTLPDQSSSRSFVFKETAKEHDFSCLRHIKGAISVETASDLQEPAIKIDLSVQASSRQLAQSVYMKVVNESPDNVEVEMGYAEHVCSEANPEMNVTITILMKDSLHLSALNLSTEHIDVFFTQSLWSKKLEMLVIETVSGKVETSRLIEADPRPSGSRKLYLRTNAGSITGFYPLADLLDIKSNVGSVEINIIPQFGSTLTEVTPAELHAISNAGLLGLNYVFDVEQPERTPDRIYMSSVKSNAGEQRCRLLHTNSTTFTSTAGSMTLEVVPWNPREGMIETNAEAASVSFRLEPQLGGQGRPLRGLAANHVTVAGSMDLVYPQDWEGEFECEILHGDCIVRGRDIHVTKSGKNIFGGSEILGYKGSRNGSVSISSVSGGSKLIIGETKRAYTA